jgi:glycogen(starch) synthase
LKIALFSKSFLPRVGGIETSTDMIAATWQGAGHDVEVVTAVADPSRSERPYRVTRSWSPGSLLAASRAADIIVSNGYSRAAVSMAAISRKRLVIFHQGYQLICSDGLGFRNRRFHDFVLQDDLKLAFAAGARPAAHALLRIPFDRAVKHWPKGIEHIVPSRHVARRLGLPDAHVIYQPPNPSVMAVLTEVGPSSAADEDRSYRTGDIVFFGRLVFEKGCDDLIRAYARWAHSGGCPDRRPLPRLVLYGEGPERERLERLVLELDVRESVDFRLFLGGRELVRVARNASVVIVPSRWEEPGATIAVELFACGAPVIASKAGAQGEIFAGHGRLFANRDISQLAKALAAHFKDGPVRPSPRGDEPWLLPAIQTQLVRLMSENRKPNARE